MEYNTKFIVDIWEKNKEHDKTWYQKDDIVEFRIKLTSMAIVGRIDEVDTSCIVVDISGKYKSEYKRVYYEELEFIKYHEPEFDK